MEDYDRTLTKADIMAEMGFNGWEADRFMKRFGHRTDFRKSRKIGYGELLYLQADGSVAKWVKENCAQGRQTVAERRG